MTIDWDEALKLADGSGELLLELIDIFLIEHAEVLPHIRRAIAENDAGQLQLYAHRLKGCLGYFGATRAADLARELEMVGRAKDLAGTAEMLARLETALAETMDEMRAYRQARTRS